MELLFKELTGKIIGAYYKVYNAMSHNYPEYIYENSMICELRNMGIQCSSQDKYQIFYKEKLIGVQKLDIFVANDIVVEIKRTPHLLEIHKAQTISYLKTTGKKVGLLFNFASSKPEFKRLFFENELMNQSKPSYEAVGEDIERHYPELSYKILQAMFEVYRHLGPGFIHRVYANACYREFKICGLPAVSLKEMIVAYKGKTVGSIKFGHFSVLDKFMVFPVAIKNMEDLKTANFMDWMRYNGIQFGIITNFHDLPASVKFVTV